MTIIVDDEQEAGPSNHPTSATQPRLPPARMGREADTDSDDLEALNAYLDQHRSLISMRSSGPRLPFPAAHLRNSAADDAYDADAFAYFDQLSDDGMEGPSGPHEPEGKGKGKDKEPEKEVSYPMEPAPTIPPQAYYNKDGSYRWL
jgi:hypothetical protein